MRFEVPQFIDIEDKIFGPLTWRQFLYVSGGIGFGVVIFLTTSFLVFLIIGLPLAVLAGALAFYPVNNRPFIFFLESIFNYVTGRKLYLWQRKNPEVHIYRSKTPKTTLVKDALPLGQGTNSSETEGPSFAKRLELEVIQKSDT